MENIIEFARTKGAKDKKQRKRRKRKKTFTPKKSNQISVKTKEELAKAKAFQTRIMPIIRGVREARGIIKMASNFSTANFADEYMQGMPLVKDMIGKKLRGRGGIVKILAHEIGTNKGRLYDYKPETYDSSQRYYQRYAQLLADTQGNLRNAKGIGGEPDHYKGNVYGQQGTHAKKGKAGGSVLTNREYNSTYGNAEFKESLLEKFKNKFKKLRKKGKRKIADAKLGTKVAGAALKGAYKTGRYTEKMSQRYG